MSHIPRWIRCFSIRSRESLGIRHGLIDILRDKVGSRKLDNAVSESTSSGMTSMPQKAPKDTDLQSTPYRERVFDASHHEKYFPQFVPNCISNRY